MKTQRNAVVFYRSFYDAIKNANPKTQLQIYNAIFEFGLNGIEQDSKLSGHALSMFMLIKPQIEANNVRYANGCKGGRKVSKSNQDETETEPKFNQKLTETQPKEKEKKKENEKEKEKVDVYVKEIEKDAGSLSDERNTHTFAIPTVEQVRDYCNERNNSVDPQYFWDFYQARGWYVKEGLPVHDWKAQVRYFEQHQRKHGANANNKTEPIRCLIGGKDIPRRHYTDDEMNALFTPLDEDD